MQIRKAAKDAHKIFRKRGWFYWDSAPNVPTVEQIEDAMGVVLRSMTDADVSQSETGRFVALKDDEGWIKLCLVLTQGDE